MSPADQPAELSAGPNLLVVIVDQWRASALGSAGADPVQTPHLDVFAKQARVLTGAVSNYPVCSPARAMLLSGAYPLRNGVGFNVNSETAAWGVGLQRATTCWSDVLAENGYWLGYIGKWHLTPPVEADETYGEGRRSDGKVWDSWTPPNERHGFAFWYSHGCCDDHLHPHYWTSGASREQPRRVRQWSPEHETDVAVGFLAEAAQRRTAGQPFALMVSFNPPHQPFDQVPERYLDLYAAQDPTELLTRPNVDRQSPAGQHAQDVAASYFAAVTGVDEQVGRLLAELNRRALSQDTVVVITSDHGMQLGSHDLMYKNVWYEESMRVPLLIRWPGRLSPGVDDVAVSSVDLAPTLLSLLGQEIPSTMQGHDLTAALRDLPDAHRPDEALYFHPAREPGDADVRGLRTAGHKLILEHRPDASTAAHLYDLEADPFELADVAAKSPELVDGLSQQLDAALTRIEDPWPAPIQPSGG